MKDVYPFYSEVFTGTFEEARKKFNSIDLATKKYTEEFGEDLRVIRKDPDHPNRFYVTIKDKNLNN